jgi:hypothetical protein
MEQKIVDIVKKISKNFGLESEALLSFISVETGGKGFDSATGKIMIQFEPTWFRKREPYAPSGAWSVNGVERQAKEWIAFNNAFSINKNYAMESTSIGLGQTMGGHWQRLGYANVSAMWDDAKKGLDRQVYQIAKFITTDARLKTALSGKDWDTVAKLYNGAGYKALAVKIGREPYNISLQKAYKQFTR